MLSEPQAPARGPSEPRRPAPGLHPPLPRGDRGGSNPAPPSSLFRCFWVSAFRCFPLYLPPFAPFQLFNLPTPTPKPQTRNPAVLGLVSLLRPTYNSAWFFSIAAME